MLDFARIKQEQVSSSVHLRLPQVLRDKAKEIAKENSTDDVKLTETDVYRMILSFFFNDSDIKNIRNEMENVFNGGETPQAS